MSEPDVGMLEQGFARTYQRLIESYCLDPAVSADQLRLILRRVTTDRTGRRRPEGSRKPDERTGGISP